jgi:hypothetical protein
MGTMAERLNRTFRDQAQVTQFFSGWNWSSRA